ncbi:OLC1v1014819C1 [Oldenlandia corymbosa var. corymbosa]|uniref:OLC1v1014819C1 n=1 Tax=Oldenlandia corymbosa var. corymbosa TaxID=529605 RepID=A0AAV1E247_OLDCO|nr:OLC1v1014819C1 [Oldenlandia corymbosa var. corymbosa]
MAASLRSNFSFLNPHLFTHTHPKFTTRRRCFVPIVCGRRDNRGPLQKGRVLSIEAIQAVQSLKRVHRTDPNNLKNSEAILSRLIKADLIATFNELLRQEQIEIALKVFSAIRSEYNPDLGLYADLVTGLDKKGLTKEIDDLVCELEEAAGGGIDWDDKGLVALVRALIAADRAESTVRIYGLMKRNGWGSNSESMDEYLAKVLIRGLRLFGEEDLADEIDEKLKRLYKGVLGSGFTVV